MRQTLEGRDRWSLAFHDRECGTARVGGRRQRFGARALVFDQRGAQRGKRLEFPIDRRDVLGQCPVHLFACTCMLGGSRDDVADLGEGEAQVFRLRDERQSRQHRGIVPAQTAGSPVRVRQETETFVVANGFDSQPACVRDVANGQCS